jgi:drug/metabolite transporter (DMT)-like permease
MKLTHGQAVWLMLAVTAMWSMAGVVTRQLEHARSFEVTFWRSFFTMVSLLVILPVWQGRQAFHKMPWRSPYFWLSGLCWSVMFTAFMLALTLTAVANVLITLALGPLMTALLGRLTTGHALPGRTWGAIALAGLGIAWIFASQIHVDSPGFGLGIAVALCVPLAGAVQWNLVQRSHAHGLELDLVPSVLLGAALSTLLTLPLALPFQAQATDLQWLALLGLFQLAIPCVLSVLCAQVLQAAQVSLLALLEVIFGIGLAWLGAHEEPSLQVLLGGTIVLCALLMNELLAWRQRHV